MGMTRARRQLVAWIACFAVLLGALAPSVSHALAASRGQAIGWDICRADAGSASPAPVADLQKQGRLMVHCAYCLPHGGSDAVLAAAPELGLVDGHSVQPFLFYHASEPLAALSAPSARGPPALS
jgi:hypothetical protein